MKVPCLQRGRQQKNPGRAMLSFVLQIHVSFDPSLLATSVSQSHKSNDMQLEWKKVEGITREAKRDKQRCGEDNIP